MFTTGLNLLERSVSALDGLLDFYFGVSTNDFKQASIKTSENITTKFCKVAVHLRIVVQFNAFFNWKKCDGSHIWTY